MKGLRRASLTLAVATAVMVGLAGSALGQIRHAEDEKITFNVGTTSDMVSANPFKACCSSEYEMLLLNYNMLYGFSAEDLSPVPELVEEPGCEPSADSMDLDVPDPGRRHVARRGAAHRRRHRVHVPLHPRQRALDVLGLPPLQPHVRGDRMTTS